MPGFAHFPYTLALLTAAAVACGVAVASWRRRAAPAARPLTILLLAIGLWALLYAVYWAFFPAPGAVAWLNATYLGVVITPAALLVMVLQFTGRGGVLTPRHIGLLAIEPVLTLVSMWTDPWHHWFFAGATPVGAYFNGGPLFWANVLYSYGLLFVAVGLLVQAVFSAAPAYRRQAGLLLLGFSAPVLSNIVGLLGLSPWPNLDLTPFAFLVTGLVFAAALFRQGLLDLVPVARDLVVERLRDGVVVLDDQERLVDFNHSAQAMLGLAHRDLGRPAAAWLAAWPGLLERLRAAPDSRQEVSLPGEPARYLEASRTPLPSRLGRPAGAILALRDVTERRRTHERLQQQLAEIQTLQVQLRDQAIRDALTGLFNRRYLDETFPRELAAAVRERRPLSLIVIDLDNFKAANDTYGHEAGDAVLTALANLLSADIRAGDLACRFGGEEFVLILPGADLADTAARAEQWRAKFAALAIRHGPVILRSTFSAGVAGWPGQCSEPALLLQAADRALYQSKAAGRNRITVSAGVWSASLTPPVP